MHLAIRFLAPVVVLALTISVHLESRLSARAGQNPPAPQNPATPAAGPAGQQPPGGGRGGGRGNPGLALYNDKCASCHGAPDGQQAGRAPKLFDQKWMDSSTDDTLTKAIRGGAHAQAGLDPAQFTDDQLFQMISFIRTQTASITPKPEFVANADGQIIKSEKQTFKIEVLTKELETPWGLAFLPDGRLLITERPGRLRILDKGKLSEPVKGTPVPHVQQDGG